LDTIFIGGGNMGYALAAALIGRGVSRPDQVLVVDPAPAARKRAEALGCPTAANSDGRVAEGRVLVLAVKPQGMAEALAPLRGRLRPEQVVVSIMAGVRIGTIQAALGHSAVVRVMPNMPAQVGLGMAVFHAHASVQSGQLASVDALLKASGEVLRVESEDLIDAATAVSASGPAYVYYVAEHWIRAAQQVGFTEAQAVLLVRQTLKGATALWQSVGTAPGRLREQVTSKGGTTAAALDAFAAAGVGTGIEAGVRSAYERAKELGR
jgi:pyrroline-5-carboxylate reductase